MSLQTRPMKTPVAAFIQWFDNLPVTLRRYLAHVYRVCTTEDTSRMAAAPDESLAAFRAWVVKLDFPLRSAAKMFYIRAVFDMVILHQKEIADEDSAMGMIPWESNVVQLSSRQWKMVIDTWKELRGGELSDTFVHAWTSWMIKKQKESK